MFNLSSVYEFIDGEKANYPIVRMCVWAEVSCSGVSRELMGQMFSGTAGSGSDEVRAELDQFVEPYLDADGHD